MMTRPSPPHHRICLLFDLDCFYAQCERIRLGLPDTVPLALLQWNAVLAVTYPARTFGIQRGDSWTDVAEKSRNQCWAIHLQLKEKETVPTSPPPPPPSSSSSSSLLPQPQPSQPSQPSSLPQRATIHNPYRKQPSVHPSPIIPQHVDNHVDNNNNNNNDDVDNEDDIGNPFGDEQGGGESSLPGGAATRSSIQEAYDQIYNLPREEQLMCQKRERNVQRHNNDGMACLERYRIASARIFSLVLERLTHHLGGKDNFVLERASIDEFYLDITEYCYNSSKLTMADMDHQTVMVGGETAVSNSTDLDDSLQTLALQRACQVSHWIRRDVWETLGFTMSAGICTNKMMAKLVASYGKPNGQAVLYLSKFQFLLKRIKMRKVRHFGGKQGKQVLNLLQELSHQPALFDPSTVTMGDLQHVPLPLLQKHFSDETAAFIFGACRGVDNEAVRPTNGALVKSITAFKSFPATTNVEEIHDWVSLMATEIVDRVAKDSVRNQRYPKTCAIHYTYYSTDTGLRPIGVVHARKFATSKSIRITFPHESKSHKHADLVQQAMEKLTVLLKQHPLRGIGLSVGNFELRGRPPEGVQGITTFFKKAETANELTSQKGNNRSNALVQLSKTKKRTMDIGKFFSQQPQTDDDTVTTPKHSKSNEHVETVNNSSKKGHGRLSPSIVNPTPDTGPGLQFLSSPASLPAINMEPSFTTKKQIDTDEEMALKLQATFDRENYVLNTTDRRFGGSQMSKPAPKKIRTIDSFFGKKT